MVHRFLCKGSNASAAEDNIDDFKHGSIHLWMRYTCPAVGARGERTLHIIVLITIP